MLVCSKGPAELVTRPTVVFKDEHMNALECLCLYSWPVVQLAAVALVWAWEENKLRKDML